MTNSPVEPPPSVPQLPAFSFKAPFPASSSSSAGVPLKQRRVSLALPSSPRLVPAWSFRDDTGLDSHVAETASSSLMPEKRRRIATAHGAESDSGLLAAQEKKQRKKWTEEETEMLVQGCKLHGVGNWKTILSDPTLSFDNRSPVDLKDRFRTYFPDAYKQFYPNAKTHLSSKVRSTLPDGSSIFEKTRSKKRRPFTEEEDRALRAGYEKHGTVWATIVRDPVFQEQNRRSTDLRDRFRNAFPELYQAAGYKPRSTVKKKRAPEAAPLPVRAATDDQLSMSSVAGPIRRRRANTNQGLLRGGTKSVPQSATCSEDEDSSGGEEDIVKSPPISISPDEGKSSVDSFEVDMDSLDHLTDSIAIPDFMPGSQSEMDAQSQTWSSGLGTPTHSHHAWSATAGSPTSSHLSSDYIIGQSSPFQRRADGFGMIGKSAWGTQDWFSANPRLDPDSSGSSAPYQDSSPFSFHNLNHGVLDRYDLFPMSLPQDFASEAGAGDSSTFSDELLFPPNGFRGFTHHSNYAGDLIFGARTHQPQQSPYFPGFGSGLGLSGLPQSAGIHPMQLHTPALPGIDEIELTGITLDDRTDAIDGPKDEAMALTDGLALQSISGIDDLAHEIQKTPPATPSRARTSSVLPSYPAQHGRSISVPPSEARSGARPPLGVHTGSHPDVSSGRSLAESAGTPIARAFPAAHAPDLYDLPFLDLHYYGAYSDGEVRPQEGYRQGQEALDLAQSAASSSALKNLGIPASLGQHIPPTTPTFVARHHRGQSAVSPQDLLLRKGTDNKRKRASWDGGAS